MNIDFKNLIIIYLISGIIWNIYCRVFFNYWIINKDILNKFTLIELPESIKCLIPHYNCENLRANGWTVLHIILYFAIGLYYQNIDSYIIVSSILFEYFEGLYNFDAKYVIDIMFNYLGYKLGVYFSKKIKPIQINITYNQILVLILINIILFYDIYYKRKNALEK